MKFRIPKALEKLEKYDSCSRYETPYLALAYINDFLALALTADEEKMIFDHYNEKFAAKLLQGQASTLIKRAFRCEVILTSPMIDPLWERFSNIRTQISQKSIQVGDS